MCRYLFIVILILFTVACSTKKKSQLPSYDAELSGFDYPFAVQKFYFSSQRQHLQMTYGDIGDKSSKKIAVLLHGKNFSGYYWHQIANSLASKGYRVIIPDQIGFGKSSKPQNYLFNFSQLANNTLRLLDSLKVQNFVVVGHSMGGMLATHLGSMTDRVQKIYLINPIGLDDYLQFVEYKDPEFFYRTEVTKTIATARDYQKKNYYDGQWSDVYEQMLQPFKGWRNGPDWEIVAWNNAMTYAPIFADPIRNLISQVKQPIYLFLGTRDKTGPGRSWKKPGVSKKLGAYNVLGKEIKALNPNRVKLYELSNLGHMPQFENYKAFSEVFYPTFE